MNARRRFPFFFITLFVPSARLLWLCGALALGICFLPGPAPLFGQGEADEELVTAHFDEQLEDFAGEVEGLASRIDAIVEAHAAGRDIDNSMKALIQAWEHVQMHEVIEAKAIHLYPPIWQGIYAMKQAGEKSDATAEMARAGEKTKGALWQGLGGLRALAALPDKGMRPDAHDHGEHVNKAPVSHSSAGTPSTNNVIELTGGDNMRYNETKFAVLAGEPVTLRFRNIGELPKEVMGHNVVVLEGGTPIEPFGLAAAEASENDFIPTESKHTKAIVAHTELLGAGESDEITFRLEEPGEYPFICSFTAHFRLMRGSIEAVAGPETDPVAAILRQLEMAVRSYVDGDIKHAKDLVHGAYMNIFEGLEGDLIEQDPELVSQLELDFNAGLPATFKEDGSPAEARKKLETMRERLLRAKKLLNQAGNDRSSVF